VVQFVRCPQTIKTTNEIRYTFKPIDFAKGDLHTPEFLAMNPYHCVPTIKHGDFCLHEHASILRYIARVFPASASKFYGNFHPQKQARIESALDERVGHLYGVLAPLVYAVMGFAPKPDDAKVDEVCIGVVVLCALCARL
jgi:glutathione S-transferase